MNWAMTENPAAGPAGEANRIVRQSRYRPGAGYRKDGSIDQARSCTGSRRWACAVERGDMLGRSRQRVNGWNIPPLQMGRTGLSDDFLLRASLQCLGGIIANDPAEAVYFNTPIDANGKAFEGGKRYTMRFGPSQLPDVNAFWSITMYDPTYNLVDNSINRYAIGNRTPDLKKDADGGLTLYIQSDSPGKNKESNWLPSTKTGSFFVIMRTCMPGPELWSRSGRPRRSLRHCRERFRMRFIAPLSKDNVMKIQRKMS